jgi:hypothetical protein
MMRARCYILPPAPRASDRTARSAEWLIRRLLSPLAATGCSLGFAALAMLSLAPAPEDRAPMLIGAAIGAAATVVLLGLLLVTSVLRASLFASDMLDDDS